MKQLDLDIARFWADDDLAHADNCFSKNAPQVALGIRMNDECAYPELSLDGHPWDEIPHKQRAEYNKRYNDKAEAVVGKRLLQEFFLPEDAQLPAFRQIGEVFGGRYEMINHTYWLHSDIKTPAQLEKQLAFAETVDLREYVLPANWELETKRIYETHGIRPSVYKAIRGPVTLATSIYGQENMIYLYYDAPELFERFGLAIARVVHEYITLFRREAGYDELSAPRGFAFNDDDSALMTPDMYKLLGYPVLKSVYARTSPDKNDTRYQHSDSAMGHLLPLLSQFNLTGCNFGPTLTVREIRKHMPATRIDGQLAPFTFMRNDPEAITAEIMRDIEMARESDARGLNISTAGSINYGSSLASLRLIMALIQNFGRY